MKKFNLYKSDKYGCKNQSYGKVISASYQHYITLTEVEDKYKPILTTITIPSWEGIDQYQEIDQAEAERIKSVKNAAKGSVEYPEQEVNQMIGLLSVSINDMKLTDEQSYKFKICILNGQNLSEKSFLLISKSSILKSFTRPCKKFQ